ncbi:hypothetical protein Rhe02_52550 [Rhizocola hellebori]|uniref:Uncharacterized protein n=1 Tax=Rhizocola hellebori TaxID=1392758 RepID=A0A8J3QAF8_9ACTN|nr:hypothetical protein Rhe02_52550 [Rhizocola hellebori]
MPRPAHTGKQLRPQTPHITLPKSNRKIGWHVIVVTDPDYHGAGDDADFEYTWDGFTDLQAFHDRAAAAGRAVIFAAT